MALWCEHSGSPCSPPVCLAQIFTEFLETWRGVNMQKSHDLVDLIELGQDEQVLKVCWGRQVLLHLRQEG